MSLICYNSIIELLRGRLKIKDMDMQKTIDSLKKKEYAVARFVTRAEVIAYLREIIKGRTVGFGGSQTLTELDLRHVLAEDNTVYVPDFAPEGENFVTVAEKTMTADIFLTSANAVSENGEIVNIDGYCNRLAGALLPHQKVYYIIGSNKIGGTLEEAINRARNVAAPKNALRLHCKTPCAMAVKNRLEAEYFKSHPAESGFDQLEWQRFIEGLTDEQLGTHCYDCQSPGRICGSMSVHLKRPGASPAEVIIIDENIGF